MDKNELLIIMTVYDGKSDEILNRKVYNFLDPKCRQIIAKTAWWAMHNGHQLVTRPKLTAETVGEV